MSGVEGRADLARDALLVRAGVGTGQGLVGHCLDMGRVDADHRRANSLELSRGCRFVSRGRSAPHPVDRTAADHALGEMIRLSVSADDRGECRV